MPDRVLPALLVVLVVREIAHNELIYPIQGQPFLVTAANGHHNQSVITERRLFMAGNCHRWIGRIAVLVFVGIVDHLSNTEAARKRCR